MRNLYYCVTIILLCGYVAMAHSVRYSIRVIDDFNGDVIENVPCETIFTTHTGDWNNMSKGCLQKGVTNADGEFTFEGESDVSHVTYSLKDVEPTYYPIVRKRLDFNSISGFVNKRWEPYDSVVTVKLQRVEHPIPLWVKQVEMGKRLHQEVWSEGANSIWRYDLMVGDWLPPIGYGKVTDLMIETHSNFVERVEGGIVDFDCYEINYLVSFPGDGNGIMSMIAEPTDGIYIRQAQMSGYNRMVKRCFGKRKSQRGIIISPKLYSDEDVNRCYTFRIRSRYDQKGNLVEAYYGKIYGDFQFSKVWIYNEQFFFLYYLNPKSLDRNLEWDMKNNLCPNPGSLGMLQP